MKEKFSQKQSGITLVALVVTIVVLLILAGITIMYTMGDNSIFKKSQEAKNKTDEAIKNEQEYMNSIDNMVNEYLNETGNRGATRPEEVPIENIKADWATKEKIAKEIGITKVIANVLPSEKAQIIKEYQKHGEYVMMCGDGINDSPALATADIGVSVNSATDIAMDSSDVILTRNRLESIIELIHISKRTIKIIKQNLFWAFFYNIIMIPVAMGVLKPIGIVITPMIASGAMVFSSITVVLNTLRLKNKSIKY